MKLRCEFFKVKELTAEEIKKHNLNINDNLYFISSETSCWDSRIAIELHMDFEKYKQILLKYNAFNCGNNKDCFTFKIKQDCENAIEDLQPYAIMNTLMGSD